MRFWGIFCVLGTGCVSQLPRKVAIITGASSGIGLATTKALISTNRWKVICACRSERKTQEALKKANVDLTNVEVMNLDLDDLRSVERFTKRIGDLPVDCLALNAGIQYTGMKFPHRSEQGFESTVATNHLGHFYITKLLLKNVENADQGRIVFVASGGDTYYIINSIQDFWILN